MPAFNDLITLAYAKTVAGIALTVTTYDLRLAALITGCSLAAANYCGRALMPGYYDELYNGSGIGYLVLRQSPLLELSSVVVGPSTSNPQTYTATDFDIDPLISKIAFKPTTAADFFYGYTTNLAFPSGINSTQATYYAGYGAIQTVAAAVVSTGSQAVTPGDMFGVTAYGDPWAIAVGNVLTVDAGLSTEEAVTVTAVSSTTFTANFTRTHAAGFRVLVPQIPQDMQMAVGFMVSNLYRQKDLTKQSERLDQYAYTLRPNEYGVAFTPEVRVMLSRYRSAFSG